jgi:hypothetical protein
MSRICVLFILTLLTSGQAFAGKNRNDCSPRKGFVDHAPAINVVCNEGDESLWSCSFQLDLTGDNYDPLTYVKDACPLDGDDVRRQGLTLEQVSYDGQPINNGDEVYAYILSNSNSTGQGAYWFEDLKIYPPRRNDVR